VRSAAPNTEKWFETIAPVGVGDARVDQVVDSRHDVVEIPASGVAVHALCEEIAVVAASAIVRPQHGPAASSQNLVVVRVPWPQGAGDRGVRPAVENDHERVPPAGSILDGQREEPLDIPAIPASPPLDPGLSQQPLIGQGVDLRCGLGAVGVRSARPQLRQVGVVAEDEAQGGAAGGDVVAEERTYT